MTADPPIAMRERTRRIVQSELTVVAQDLFVESGYEAVTVEQIAAAAGMSKRTFFRYFSSKEDLVIGKYDLFGDKLAESLAVRPAEESVWEALRRVFDFFVEYVDDPKLRERRAAMERIVQSTPALNAAYLEKMSRMQKLLEEGVAARLGIDQRTDPRPGAIVGAAFACLLAAQVTWHESDQAGSFGPMLDDAMAAFHLYPPTAR
ncbi:TetR family transcriptional regulator [Agromyces albus]|nr:TetR family transcriptional regulator [Agromyces albus]